MFSLAVIEYLATVSLGLKITATILAIVCIFGFLVLVGTSASEDVIHNSVIYKFLLVIAILVVIAIFTPDKNFWDVLREMYSK